MLVVESFRQTERPPIAHASFGTRTANERARARAIARRQPPRTFDRSPHGGGRRSARGDNRGEATSSKVRAKFALIINGARRVSFLASAR